MTLATKQSLYHDIASPSDAQKERNHLPLTPDGNLTTAVKKQIFLNNIFGVDIDAQAVEVMQKRNIIKRISMN
jgi:hypothetical protein